MKKLKKIFLILFLVLILLVTASVIFKRINGKQLSVFGYELYVVISGSMEPEIKTGSVVISSQKDIKEIKDKDIIVFKIDGQSYPITHRVIEIFNQNDEIEFQTKGDANNIEDPFIITKEEYKSKVLFFIPYLGYAILFLQSPIGIITAILICFIIYITNLILRKNKSKK